MRTEFLAAIEALLPHEPTAVFMTGDIGFNAFEPLARRMGKRFINTGVAEQNMIGVAAGMALAGLRCWVYSITPFITLRCLEQIRNDVCWHGLPVRLVGNGGGYSYGIMGSSHHGLEDLGVMKTLPNMQLFFPCTKDQVATAVQHLHAATGPTYLRLGGGPCPEPPQPLAEQSVTLTRCYSRGGRATLIGVGQATQIILAALEIEPRLARHADIFGVARFPFDPQRDAALCASVAATDRVCIVDEHFAPGSLAESLLLCLPRASHVRRLHAGYNSQQRHGSHAFHLEQAGLSPRHLCAQVADWL